MGPMKLRWGSADGMAIRGRGVELHITQCSGGSDPSCKSVTLSQVTPGPPHGKLHGIRTPTTIRSLHPASQPRIAAPSLISLPPQWMGGGAHRWSGRPKRPLRLGEGRGAAWGVLYSEVQAEVAGFTGLGSYMDRCGVLCRYTRPPPGVPTPSPQSAFWITVK